MLFASISGQIGDLSIRARFSVGRDSILVLCGPSGAGKTTIINMLAGLLEPGGGKIQINGECVFNSHLGINLPPQKRRFGYVFQEGRLFPHLSVHSNLIYGMKLLPESDRKFGFDQVIDMLGIERLLSRRPARLSGGEKQRVAIGRSLLMSPSLLLMDEPLASLDDDNKAGIMPFISAITRDLHIPVIYITHSKEEIDVLADKVIRVENGIAVERPMAHIKNTKPAPEFVPTGGLLQSA